MDIVEKVGIVNGTRFGGGGSLKDILYRKGRNGYCEGHMSGMKRGWI